MMRRHNQNKKWRWIVFIVAVLIQGCTAQSDRISGAIQAQLTGSARHWPAITGNLGQLQKYYQQRDYHPLWIDERGPLPRAAHLLATLLVADKEGLDPNCYNIQTIKQMWPVKMTAALARLELLLTNTFIQYSDDVRNGLLQPDSNDRNWRSDDSRLTALPLLDELLTSRSFATELKTLPPPQQGYQDLRKVLHLYQAIAKQGDWPRIPNGPSLRQGQRHPQLRLVRQRLMIEDGRLKSAADNSVFDKPLHSAVQRFQRRHNLAPQGIVGVATRRAMNIPIAERIEQLKVNMDRWRWLPRQLGDDYIMVNTPAYQLTAYVDEEPDMVMRVITGKPERPSPIVGGKLVQVIINPDWIVPPSIAVKDIIPRIKADPDYLTKKKIRIFTSSRRGAKEVDPDDIDWSTINTAPFPYTFVQEPGEGNSLGRIKFIFLNDFAVFLHDTPRRKLFERNKRALSSGCIRVEEPKVLASFLLGEDSGWDDEELEQSIEEGDTEKLQLVHAIPVYLVYWTAWVDDYQRVNFREDIYDWDRIKGKCV